MSAEIDWRTPAMGQSNPSELRKIHKNILDLERILKPEHSLIDVGCGQGFVGAHLRHANYLGVDLFQENIDKARSFHPGLNFECKDLLDLDGKWDVVFACRVVMHIPMFETVVKKLLSCAKEYVVMVVPVGQDSCGIEDHGGEKIYFQTFSPARCEALGKCAIYQHEPYCTVIYGPGLS